MPDDYSWDSENVAIACGVSIGAGLATGIGGLVVFAPQLLASVPKGTILAIALAISAGLASASELAPMLNASGRRQSQAAETKT